MAVDLLNEVNELTVSDFLNRLRGKQATLMLANGGSVSGTIAEQYDYTSPHSKMVHVMTLTGQDFFDAVIPKDSVVGFVFRKPGMP